MNYLYSAKNNFENPQKYMYTPFNGKGFITSYLESREVEIFTMKNSENELKKIINSNVYNLKLESILSQPIIETVNILSVLIKDISNQDNRLSYKVLSKLIKKYEVFRKVYSHYNSSFRKSSNTSDNILVYSLLSLACGMYFNKSNNFKFLNVQLKLNDALISINTHLDFKNIIIVSKSIEMELTSINGLLKSKQIMI